MTSKEIREKRAALAKQIRDMADKINAEGYKRTAEDDAAWAKVNVDYDAFAEPLKIAERAEAIEAEQRAGQERNRSVGREDRDNADREREDREDRDRERGGDQITDEMRSRAVSAWARAQFDEDISEEDEDIARRVGISPHRRQLRFRMLDTRSRRELQRSFRSVHSSRAVESAMECRSPMSTQLAADGGAIVFPTFMRTLEVNLLAFGGMRQVAELMTTTSGEEMSWPTVDDTSNTGVQVGESANVDNSGAGGAKGTWGTVKWNAYKFSSQAILVPFELLQDAAINLEQVLGQMIGERLGRITNTKFTTGSGASTPKGIVTAASSGVTAASTSAIAFDEVIRLEHSVDPAYRNGAGYMCHDAIVLALRLLKDGEGQYLWQSGARDGTPDRLNGRPFTVNQDMASSIASGAKTLLFGQLSKYKIRTAGSMRLYRLQERYRDSDNDGFIGLIREDGNLLTAGTAPVKYLVH